MKAFIAGEKLATREAIRTRNNRLQFDGRMLTLATRELNDRSAIGFCLEPGQHVFMTEHWFDWQQRLLKVVATSGVKCTRYFFRWSISDPPKVLCDSLFENMENLAVRRQDKTRAQLIAEWCKICHDIGFGAYIGAPPNTGN